MARVIATALGAGWAALWLVGLIGGGTSGLVWANCVVGCAFALTAGYALLGPATKSPGRAKAEARRFHQWDTRIPNRWDTGEAENPTVLDLFPEIDFRSSTPGAEATKRQDLDARIRDAILLQLSLHPRALGIHLQVSVLDGEVALRGTLRTAADRRMVRAIVISTDGVREIDDGIVIASPKVA